VLNCLCKFTGERCATAATALRGSPMPSHEITVAVYDKDPLSRAGLIDYLEKQQNIVVRKDRDSAPVDRAGDVAVMVIDQPDTAATTLLRQLVIDLRQKVVLVTNDLDEPQLNLVLDAGVQTIVWRRQATVDRLVRAVRASFCGEGEVPPDLLSRLLQIVRMRRGGDAALTSSTELTDLELGVLRLVAKGLETKEIAEQLCYSERTVKSALHDIMVRIRLRNRPHAVAFAIRAGYI